MEDVGVIVIRTFFLYATILTIFRLMGKREIGELSILDLVVFIMIAELAVLAIEQPTTPLVQALIPMILLLVIQIITAWISLKSKKFRELMDGTPTVIINRGKIDERAMRKQRYNFDDLLLQLREKDIDNVAEVDFAILEPSGKLSVFQKKEEDEKSITLPLILDGIIQESHLATIERTSFWLRKELKERGFTNIKAISFCSFQGGEFYIEMRDET
ncbi:DUF421 domain-containing protein [Bacillus sp. 2205SS5-2]|uniref:DUF421 domain-containing protein n=1 Tax=Bacillus sp. 2205SS5-2 TaxID=3109031 RepID=UPI00300546CF